MRPEARVAALIEIIEQIEESIANGGAPADSIVTTYFRTRRYAGSKDRRAITAFVYGVLRSRERLLYSANRLGKALDVRLLVILYLALNEKDQLASFAEGGSYGPAPLSTQEIKCIEELAQLSVPDEARLNIPGWAVSEFVKRYGDTWHSVAASLNQSATLDMRLNILKANTEQLAGYAGKLEGFSRTDLSPIGIRSERNVSLGGMKEYKQGIFEVQDEAAQIASLLVEANPGMQVLDMCAGAGGKALAVAAQMSGKGQVHAFDISEGRLSQCRKRAKRAGAHNIQTKRLATSGEARAAELAPFAGKADRVYVDVPCSGSGTWRRSPDQRWRLSPDRLAALNESQYNLLEEASACVNEAGRLIYMTCSVLPCENEAIVQRFLRSHESWKLLNYKDIWPAIVGGQVPKSSSELSEVLQLSPEKHQTDGFFVAILVRS